MLFGKLYRLEEALQVHGQRQKLKNWENWTTRIKELMGDCEDKLADLKSKEEPKDGKELEQQIIIANVRSGICCLCVFPLQGQCFCLFGCLVGCFWYYNVFNWAKSSICTPFTNHGYFHRCFPFFLFFFSSSYFISYPSVLR